MWYIIIYFNLLKILFNLESSYKLETCEFLGQIRYKGFKNQQ